jgi:hypothetical protein
MVQKLSFTANSVVLGTGNSRVILGADSGKLIVKDRHANTSTVQPGSGVIGATSVTTYANNSVLPMAPVSAAGALAYSSGNNTLFLSNGSGWYKITTVNQAPTITLSATAAEPTKTSLTLDFTYTIAEPEGTPTTTTLANSGIATVGNVAITHTTSNNHIRMVFDGTTSYTDATVTLSTTDGVNIGTGTITITTAYVNLESSYTTLIAKANGNTLTNANFDDAGASNHTVTSNGDARLTSFAPFHPGGYSAYFDGSTHMINCAADDGFDVGTGVFTLEAWVICEAKGTDTYYRRIYSNDGPSGNSNGNLQMTINPTTGSIDMWTNSGDLDLAGTIAIDDGEWHHVAIVRVGTTVTSYVDGAISRSGTYSGAIGAHNSGNPRPRIGSYNGSDGDFKGYIHSLRFTNTSVYTGIFNPPADLTNISGTQLLMALSPIPRDGSASGLALTETGVLHKRINPPGLDYGSWKPETHGSSMYIDGNGDYLSHNDIGMSGLNDFTVEAWVYPAGGFKSYANSVYGSGPSANLAGTFIYYGWSSNGTAHMFSNKSNNSTPAVEGSAGDIVLDRWQHVAFVRASNQASIYVNGIKVAGPTSMTGTMAAAPTGRAYIGTQSYAEGDVNRTIKGYISDFRLHNTCLYTSNFTPPTTKLTATSGTQYLQGAVKPGIYDGAAGAGNSNGTGSPMNLVGNVQSSTATKKYALSSMDFDGTGDYITFEHIGGLGDGDFTLEAWVYHDTLGTQSWFSTYRGSTGFNAGTDADGDFFWNYNGSRLIDVASQISATTWYHVAFVRTNGVLRGYLNGVQKGTDVSSTTDYSAKEFAIGSSYNAFTEAMDGHIEDFRFTKGFSRYPFIPLKETLTTSTSMQSGITLTASNTKLLTGHAASITDGSATGHTITASGDPAVSNFGPATGMKSIYFDGAGDYLTITSHADFNLDQAGDWTAEFWMWLDGTQPGSGGTPTAIISKQNGSGSGARGWYISFKDTDDKIQTGHGGAAWVATATNSIKHYKWHHVAVTMKGSTNTHTVFIDGKVAGTNTSWDTSGNSSNFLIGKSTTGGDSNLLKGYISNLRIVRGQEIYTANFTPPTAELY